MNKPGGTGNNTQPTHFINLQADTATNLINSQASVESIKKKK